MSSSDNPQFEPQPPASGEAAVPVEPVPSVPDPVAFSSAAPPILAPTPATPPVENPVWSGWDVLAIAVLTFVAGVASQLALTIAAHSLWYPHEDLTDILSHRPILLLVSQCCLYLALAVCMILFVRGKHHTPFWRAIRWNWPESTWKFLALGVGLLFGLSLLESLLPMPKDTPFEHLFDRPLDAYLLSIIAVTIGPLMEELFFRGFLYPVLARRVGVTGGILITAVPFALLHLQQYGWAWAAVFVIFLVGVVCGVVRAVTKSVGASFLVHAGYNGTQMLIAVVATHGFRHMEKATGVLR